MTTLILTRYSAEADNLRRAMRGTDLERTHTVLPVFAVSVGHRFERVVAAFHPELDVLECEGQDCRATRVAAERRALDENWRCTLRSAGRIEHRPLHGVWSMVYRAPRTEPFRKPLGAA